MEGFPVAKISQQVIAPALETIRSAAAYAKSIECKNLIHLIYTSNTEKKNWYRLDDQNYINYSFNFFFTSITDLNLRTNINGQW